MSQPQLWSRVAKGQKSNERFLNTSTHPSPALHPSGIYVTSPHPSVDGSKPPDGTVNYLLSSCVTHGGGRLIYSDEFNKKLVKT